jgi:hypothetical protein
MELGSQLHTPITLHPGRQTTELTKQDTTVGLNVVANSMCEEYVTESIYIHQRFKISLNSMLQLSMHGNQFKIVNYLHIHIIILMSAGRPAIQTFKQQYKFWILFCMPKNFNA